MINYMNCLPNPLLLQIHSLTPIKQLFETPPSLLPSLSLSLATNVVRLSPEALTCYDKGKNIYFYRNFRGQSRYQSLADVIDRGYDN